jgi:steroid delta-isomerase-like uncharacterized protein
VRRRGGDPAVAKAGGLDSRKIAKEVVLQTEWLEGFLQAWQGHVRAGGPGGGDDGRRITDLFDQDGVWEDVAAGVSYRGHPRLRQMFEESYRWAPALVFDVVHAHGSDDRYVIEWEMHAEGNGEFGDTPATEKPFRVRGVSLGEVGSNGKVRHHRDYWDRLAWMSQVGIAPVADQP